MPKKIMLKSVSTSNLTVSDLIFPPLMLQMVLYITEYTRSLLYKSRYMQLFYLSIHINVENRRSDFNKFGALDYIHTLLDAIFIKFLSATRTIYWYICI